MKHRNIINTIEPVWY